MSSGKTILVSIREFRNNMGIARQAIDDLRVVTRNLSDQLGVLGNGVDSAQSLRTELSRLDARIGALGTALEKNKGAFDQTEQTALNSGWGVLQSDRLEKLYYDNKDNSVTACMLSALMMLNTNKLNNALIDFSNWAYDRRNQLLVAESQLAGRVGCCGLLGIWDLGMMRTKKFLDRNWRQLCEFDHVRLKMLDDNFADLNTMLERSIR